MRQKDICSVYKRKIAQKTHISPEDPMNRSQTNFAQRVASPT